MPTHCSANTLSYDNSQTLDCGPDHSCVTMTLYQTVGFEGEPTANIMCGTSTSVAFALIILARFSLAVRDTLDETLTGDAGQTGQRTPSTVTSIPNQQQHMMVCILYLTLISTHVYHLGDSCLPFLLSRHSFIDSDSPLPTSPHTSHTSHGIWSPTSLNSPSDHKSPSQAWIAGAVVGPIAAIAAILLALWWWRRRINKRRRRSVRSRGGGGGSSIPGLLLSPDRTESDRWTTRSHHAPSEHTSRSVAYSHSRSSYQRQSVPSIPGSGFAVPAPGYQNAMNAPLYHVRSTTPSEIGSVLLRQGQGQLAGEGSERTSASQPRPGPGERRMRSLPELPAHP